MNEWIILLLLPLAAWSGWWISMRKEARDLRLSKSRSAYFEGLSFLLNDQTDRAINVFLKMAEIDQQTFDNQLTLGTLFRKRGELDRALHIHQQLANLPNLSPAKNSAVQFELAEDYLQSGMYRQAQQIFEALDDTLRKQEILQALRQIYERTEQWQSAIAISHQWKLSGYGECQIQIAHYHCELAQIAIQEKDYKLALKEINTALDNDKRCARAYWMRAELALVEKEFVTAIHNYHSIAEQSKDFIPNILPALYEAYKAIQREDEYFRWLEQTEAQHNFIRMTLATAEILQQQSPEQSHLLLKKRLEQTKNPLLLSAFLHNQQDSSLKLLDNLIGNIMIPITLYQCNECGFRQQRIIWHCPACHIWNSCHPVLELKLEQR